MEQATAGNTTRVLKAFYTGEASIIKKTENNNRESVYFTQGNTEAGKELDVYTESVPYSFDCFLDYIRQLTELIRLAGDDGGKTEDRIILFDVFLRDAEIYIAQLYHALKNSGLDIEFVRLHDHTCNNALFQCGNQIIDIKISKKDSSC